MARTRAIIIGGSLAGLSAGRVLSEFVDQVTVLERDTYPTEKGDRKGVPQARHNHSLLARGTIEFERLFPGFQALAISRGAELRDATWDMANLTPFGWAPRYKSNLRVIAGSRALLEGAVRDQFRKLPNVEIRSRITVTGLKLRSDRGVLRCVGVQTPVDATDGETQLEADLVVDASGANSRAPAWFEAAGLSPPRETVVDPMAGYSSRWFVVRDPGQWPSQWWWKILATARQPDETLTEAIMSRLEHGRWHLTVGGFNRRYPPSDETEFMAMLPRLRTPLFAEMASRMEPVSPVYSFRRLDNRFRHYERWGERLAGFVAVGDAAAVFNPVYATGMSAAAMSARVLRASIGRHGLAGARMPRRFFAEQAAMLRDPWMWSAALDMRLPSTIGERGASIRLFNFYLNVASLAAGDPVVRDAFVDAANLLRPTSAIYRWPVIRRVLGAFGRYLAGAARGHAPALPPIPALPPPTSV